MPPSPTTSERPQVTVVGAGAIGGLIAARLALGGRSVAITSRRPVDALELQDDAGTHRPPVVLVSSPAEVRPSDWVVLATKAYDIEAAGPWLEAAIDERTWVAVAQNGIDHADRVSRWVPADRVAPLIVRHGAERPVPGVVRHTLAGEVAVPDDEPGRAFRDLADGCGLAVEVRRDFGRVQWTKLAWNLVGNSLSTIVDVPVREIGRRTELRLLASHLVAECRAAAAAEGVVLAADLEDDILETFAAYGERVRSSMWQDREAGRRFEHTVISGAVVGVAERHGLQAPYSDTVTQLLASISTRWGDPSDARTHAGAASPP